MIYQICNATAEPILENTVMGTKKKLAKKKGKEMLKRASYLKIWGKMHKIWKYFEKGQVIPGNNCMQ